MNTFLIVTLSIIAILQIFVAGSIAIFFDFLVAIAKDMKADIEAEFITMIPKKTKKARR